MSHSHPLATQLTLSISRSARLSRHLLKRLAILPPVLVALIAILFAGQFLQPVNEAGAQEMKVMSFNIRYDNRGDGQDAWPHRQEFVKELIAESSADVIGMQEALPNQIEDLERLLTDYDWFGAGRDNGKGKGEFVPVFYRRDRFEKLDGGHFWLSLEPDKPGSKNWDAAITRMVTWLRLKDRESDREIFVANTHFDHRGSEARLESARLIRRQLKELAGDVPLVLTGDFNCDKNSKPFAALTRKDGEGVRFFDSRALVEGDPIGPDSTWNGFREIRPGQRIDFVFVDANWKVNEHRTWDNQYEGRFPSDHLPVTVVLERK